MERDGHPYQSITYKTVGSLPIKLDLYLPSASSSSSKTPILVWYHGGGLLNGSRAAVKPHTYSPLEHGYALVSPDYRLAPQVPAREILTDVLDCLSFVRDKLQEHVPASSGITFDKSRICVSGSSAGGYISLLAGLYSDVPKVLLPIYPMTDCWGTFFTNPQMQGVKEGHIDKSVVAPFLDKNAEVMADNDPSSPRQLIYSYMLQEAILPELWDVEKGDEKMTIRLAIMKKGSMPPSYIVHGDADTRVGVEQADEVVQALKDIGAEVVYERLPGLDHSFDIEPKYTMDEMYAFMYKHMQ
ncbi:alpha/beta-hydrolase [Rhizodiscina lignyota]|uniref:Alpha/beta-hydrolase n=1 Tax=Rhizodiscina lignyota TaxID=1504668 RepID=A0A9P4IG13_9PEZI|nr:alpha/beta-hydrolase [Rhizodiscina lignyota]